jgi:nucleoid-associated protein YgaU
MGLFSKIFGKKEAGGIEAPTKSFSQHLRDAGQNPDGLKFGIGSDGTLTVSGELADDAARAGIVEVLNGIPGVNAVNDQMTVAAAETVEQAAESVFGTGDAGDGGGEAVVEASGDGDAGGRTYTVQSGDTLWKISQEMYGSGGKYMKIFEANTSILDNPDKIFPGQELTIPDLDD